MFSAADEIITTPFVPREYTEKMTVVKQGRPTPDIKLKVLTEKEIQKTF